MLEGTPTMNRGVASVQLTWQPAHIMAVGGGGEAYQSDMPADLAASTPGNLTQLVWQFSGTTIKHYTNGRRMYTLDKQFARGRVLRVWLGGADEGPNAVHLAGLRVLAGAVAASVVAQTPGGPMSGGASGSSPQPNSPATNSTQAGSGGANRVVSNVAVTQVAAGPLVTWNPVNGASSYTVKRWKLNDATCCTQNSPVLVGPPWQDGTLPVAGTYVYEVTAMNPAWIATGQAQFVQFKGPGQIATVVPSPATPSPSSSGTNPAVTSGVTGVTGSGTAPNSAIKYFLPPPPRTISLNGISGAGMRPLSPRTLDLSVISAAGMYPSISPRTIVLAPITATAALITVSRTPIWTGASLTPVSRTITLMPISANGVNGRSGPRTMSLSGWIGTGALPLVAPRILNLTGWSGIGPIP